MQHYRNFVSEFEAWHRRGRSLPMGESEPVSKIAVEAGAPTALIFSPHPDDECIIGALPLRLLREAKMRVANVAVTQGSKKSRQEDRLAELRRACDFIGYDLITTRPGGLEKVNPKTRESEPALWEESVAVIRRIIEESAPRAIFFPHELDWNSSHIGTHLLVVDALRSMGPNLSCLTFETEFWGQNYSPNLMVESSAADVADLVAGTSFHVGEVTRNPFHLFLPAWMQDNVRRGSEIVMGQGEAAPDWTFATLYRFRRWQNGAFQEVLAKGRALPAGANPQTLFK
jgi:LmbE family N-acetylglucosaminyl deacetylase